MLPWVALRPFLPYVVGIAGIAAIVYMIDDRAFNSGVRKTVERYEEAMREERERLREANDAALEAARQREQALRDQLEARNAEIQRILEEGLSDPDAGRRAIGPDSVSRINRVR